jgi:hypothetical protein
VAGQFAQEAVGRNETLVPPGRCEHRFTGKVIQDNFDGGEKV